MGTVTGGGYFLPTANCTISATPIAGYAFQYWQNSAGTIVSYSSTYTFTASSSNTYTAFFKQIGVSFVTPNSGAEIKEELTKKVEEIIATDDYKEKIEQIANELVDYSINGYKEDMKNRIRQQLVGNIMDAQPQYCGISLVELIRNEVNNIIHY